MHTQIDTLARDPAIAPILAHWAQHAGHVVREALAFQAIPAPTFEEHARAQAVESRLRQIGLADIHQDAVGNVYGRLPGPQDGRPGVLVSAHLDTVFPPSTDLKTSVDDESGRVFGPGLGDNSLSLAAMVALAEQIKAHGLRLPADLWLVATVGEEGLGNLRGMRAVTSRLGPQIGVGLVLEGIGLGWVYHAGLGVRRLRIRVTGPGGHSWLHPAPPSAIHQLARMAAALVDEINVPEEPRSAFNIGLIEGGTSVNTRAAHASLFIDLRSVDAARLVALETQARAIVERFDGSPDLATSVELVGDRPSAALAREHVLVRAAMAVLERLGWKTPIPAIGSTDANALLAEGIPAVCIGITTGGCVHTTGEYIDTGPVPTGMAQLTLLALLAAANVEQWQAWHSAQPAGPS